MTQNILLIAALFVSYGAYQGIFRAVGKALASDFVPERLRASGIGWYNTMVGLLQLVASIGAGLLWDRIGHTAVFSRLLQSRFRLREQDRSDADSSRLLDNYQLS